MATKELQEKVLQLCLKEKIFDPQSIKEDVDYFFNDLGLHPFYFSTTEPEMIAKHIMGIKANHVAAASSDKEFEVLLQGETENFAFFGVRSNIAGGRSHPATPLSNKKKRKGILSAVEELERKIEEEYLNSGTEYVGDGVPGTLSVFDRRRSINGFEEPKQYRLQCYRSEGPLKDSKYHLRLYFLAKPDYVDPYPAEDETDLNVVASKSFLATGGPFIREKYQSVIRKAKKQMSPVVETDFWTEPDGKEKCRLTIAIQFGTTHSYFAGVADVYRRHGLYTTRKYVEFFSNGIVVYAFYLCQLDGSAGGASSFQAKMQNVVYDVSLHFVLPRTSLTPLLKQEYITTQESAYAYAAWKFAFHFLQRLPDGYMTIAESLRKHDQNAYSSLQKLRFSMKTNTFTEGQILDTIFACPAAIHRLYTDFHARFCLNNEEVEPQSVIMADIRRMASSDREVQIFETFLRFNRHIVRTNFFKPNKVALSFRLNPGFLSNQEYPTIPYAIIYIVGSEFRGFHVRFEDIARGGIRLIRSSHSQVFQRNTTTLFDENYNLAYTQQKKNKDIPEGGSKGTILLNLAHQDKAIVAFKKYIDSLLDLLLPSEDMIDLLKKEEILFLGPDEGTADLMDWASQRARERGYRYWKAFTTGKSASRGGIPHDTYGMTTHGVRQYVLGIQRKLGLKGKITKVQTGGPDGDLGSNEILMSRGIETTVAVVDGSGVLHDPQGIDAEELVQLARQRKMVVHVDRRKLSKEGYLLTVDQNNVTLPDGTVVENGTVFRNLFHLDPRVTADFFVPCGGRPESVNINNVEQFAFAEGNDKLRFKYIVEGANLFITQDARLALEEKGVILFKDASANKGGVTSSSLEVLAALVLNDEEFAKQMAVTGEKIPEFYANYVKEVQDRIDLNAQLEFECLWMEHQKSRTPLSVLSDQLSAKIVELTGNIQHSESLWRNQELRNKVLKRAIPLTLQKVVNLETILNRLPVSYQRALFASQLSSHFVYNSGLRSSEFSFYEFVENYLQ